MWVTGLVAIHATTYPHPNPPSLNPAAVKRTEENNVVLFGSEPPTPFRLPDFSLSISSLCVGITTLPVQAYERGGGATQEDIKKL